MSGRVFASYDEVAALFPGVELPDVWREAHAVLSDRGFRCVPFDIDVIADTASRLGFDDELSKGVVGAAETINENPTVGTAAEIANYLLFTSPDRETVSSEAFPIPSVRYFYLPPFLAAVPGLRSRHAALGIPESATMLLLEDLLRWVEEYRIRTGVRDFGEMKWLRHHFWGDLYQIGRLQYQFDRHVWPYRVYRRISGSASDDSSKRSEADDLRIIVDGVYPIREDGQFSGADSDSLFPGPPSPDHGSTGVSIRDGILVAHMVKPDGSIGLEPSRIDTASYRCILEPGDPVLAVHIPGGGSLEVDVVDRSFRDALDFFRRYFPDFIPKAFTCDSWLLDPALGEYLSVTSNIISFQRRFCLVPMQHADDLQHFERIFPGPLDEVSDRPRDTRLKRALFERVETGRCWRITGGIIPI